MTRLFAAVACCVGCVSLSFAADKPAVLELWPGKAPGETVDIGEEKVEPPRTTDKAPIKRLTNVSKPTITVYRPVKDKNTGTAIVVAPGGGYRVLAWEHEGEQVAEWLQNIGVTAVLLKYRVPRRPDAPQDQPPVGALQDAQRAMSLTRSHAKEWGVNPEKVGFLGFSAGGHLTAWVSTNFDKRAYDGVDGADKLSSRPDFAVVIYPGGLLDKTDKEKLAPEIRVSKDTPPSFLVVAVDDKGSFDSTLKYTLALKAAGVGTELHVYSSGGHGFGMRKSDKPFATWTKRCEDWMRAEGFVGGKVGASPVAPDAKVEKLADGFQFTEGPAVDAEGNVYFTDQPNDRIHKWSTDGKLSTFLEKCGRSNGLCFDKDGKLWACADDKNELWKIDVGTKEHVVVAKDYKGKKLNGPNDVWVRPDGGAYFTDPFYKRPYWDRGPEEQDKRGVFYLSSKGELTRVDDDYGQPNGLVGTPDGKTLYVADIGKQRTYVYDIKEDGTLADRREFCKQGSDGMTLDTEGNVYLTGKGVSVYDKAGVKVAQIDVPEPWTANVCFGGKDLSTLFITAGKGLYAVKTRVKGAARQ